MGATEPGIGQSANEGGAGLRQKRIFASNTGVCVEDSYPEGAVLLNVGSGDIKWKGWVNVDGHTGGWVKEGVQPDVVSDIRSLPFDDDYADALAAIHVLEHFYYWEAADVLKEWKRVLKPGGKLILELPSMDKVFRYIADATERREPLSPSFSLFPLWGDYRYKSVEMCHKWGYFYSCLKEDLLKAGFINVKAHKARYHFPNRDMRVEAFKP